MQSYLETCTSTIGSHVPQMAISTVVPRLPGTGSESTGRTVEQKRSLRSVATFQSHFHLIEIDKSTIFGQLCKGTRLECLLASSVIRYSLYL